MFFDTVSALLQRRPTTRPQRVDALATAAEAARLMERQGLDALLVTNGTGIEGILTGSDLVKRMVARDLDPRATAVGQLMTTPVTTVTPTTRLVHVAALMAKDGLHHLPVVDGDKVLALLSMAELSDWLIEELRVEVAGALWTMKTARGESHVRRA
jgi:CBS domain-containing protein